MKKVLALSFLLFLISCGNQDDGSTDPIDNFDRAAMLENWADQIILPSYSNYVDQLSLLESATVEFVDQADLTSLQSLRGAWLDAYLAFQRVSMFEIGPAEAIGFRNYTNVYPTNTAEIEDYVASGTYNLELPSTLDAQGFPALDYLLYGLGSTDQEVLALLSSPEYRNYLVAVVDRMKSLGESILSEWQNSYRDVFVDNNGSSATSSVNKMVNDLMFYYEKALRAGKVGIPAGVFSGSPLGDRVEGYYSKVYSKQLFNEALMATVDFFQGKQYGASTTGPSLASYLDYLNGTTNGEQLSGLIENQFEEAMLSAQSLNDSFFDQVTTDNSKMLLTYDELQKAVVLLKVDMFQTLNIRIDYVDADGD